MQECAYGGGAYFPPGQGSPVVSTVEAPCRGMLGGCGLDGTPMMSSTGSRGLHVPARGP